MLLNLLSNAVKFTEEGEVVVHVDAERSRRRARIALHLAVRDTGIGIPPDRIDRLFAVLQPGRRLDDAPLRRHGPRPRDLEAPRRADGRDDVGRERGGQGIDVPRRRSPPRRRRCRPAIAVAERPPQLAGKRLLVVDDNATNREIVGRQTRSWGMEPVAIARPSEALALIEDGEHFDVAVLDLVMPEMDGLALAREIRRHRDERELPLVLAHLARTAAAGAARRTTSPRSWRSRSRPRSSTTRC